MRSILRTELWKLKRYHIIWAGVVLMLLSVLLTLFTSMANDGSVWDFAYLEEQVIKNNMFTIFPMCITLLAGYIISREKNDDTIKNILVIPISNQKLLAGKLIVCGVVAVFLGIISTCFTLVAEILVGFPGFSLALAFQSFFQITMCNFFLYIAVLPIIVISAKVADSIFPGVIIAFVYGYGGMFAAGNMTLANVYPVTACLGLIGYRSYDAAVSWNKSLCICSLGITFILSLLLLTKGKEKETSHKKRKKSSAQMKKKGW